MKVTRVLAVVVHNAEDTLTLEEVTRALSRGRNLSDHGGRLLDGVLSYGVTEARIVDVTVITTADYLRDDPRHWIKRAKYEAQEALKARVGGE